MSVPNPSHYFAQMSILPAVPSGEKDASALIYTGKCLLTGIKVLTDGINQATVIIYNNTSAAGTVVDKFVVAGAELYGGAIYGKSPIVMTTGIYVSLAGSGAKYYVFYFNGPAANSIVTWGLTQSG